MRKSSACSKATRGPRRPPKSSATCCQEGAPTRERLGRAEPEEAPAWRGRGPLFSGGGRARIQMPRSLCSLLKLEASKVQGPILSDFSGQS